MLSPIKIARTIEVPYSGAGLVFPIVTFNLEPDQPFNMAFVGTTITAGAAIMIANFTIRDDTGATVMFLGNIPWLFAGTTFSTTITKTPEAEAVAVFAARAISGIIPKDFFVFNNWTIQFVTLFPDAGHSVVATIGLNDSWQADEYN